MRLVMKTHFYSNGKITLYGKKDRPVEVDVPDDVGNYLATTFPQWFEKVETKEDKLEVETAEQKIEKKTTRKRRGR